MGRYMKQKTADWLLCTVVSASLIPVICSGFVLTDPWSQSLAVILFCSLLLQALFTLLSRSRGTTLLGIGVGAALAVAAFAWMRAAALLSGEAADSTAIFVLIQIIAPLLVFLLSRSRPGIIALLLIGNFLCAGGHFLQYPVPDWCLFPFLGGTALLFFLRVYTVSAQTAELGRAGAGSYLRQMTAVCAAALAVAVGIYAAVIVPLDPPTRELKLISELRSMELMQVLGISSTEIILDPELTADAPPEEAELDREQEELQETPDNSGETQTREDLTDILSSAFEQTAQAIRYDDAARSRLWLVLLIPAAVIAAYALRYVIKRRWHRRVRALPMESAVVNYYHFFLSRFRRLGWKKQPGQTLREFAGITAAQMESFDECGVSFRKLTGIYERVVYGQQPVEEQELQCFERFYASFYPALRREVGTLRYYCKAFRY